MNLRSGLSRFATNPFSRFHRSTSTTTTTAAAAICCLLFSGSTTVPGSYHYHASAMATTTTTRTLTTAKDPRFRTWPITATSDLEPKLREMGLELSAGEIDGTGAAGAAGGGTALSDALVSVGTAGRGGTGSFVSKDGLIVTNWHVAYDAVRRASLDAKDDTVDYVRDGFVARSRTEEIEGPNYECWITASCLDVSEKVLAAVSDEALDPLARADAIRNIRQELAQSAQESAAASSPSGSTGIRCDVVEMIPDKSYVLFTYQRLRDVRIVYVPPKALGNFGGDTDNFEWPRHTADFTLLRAYVPPPTSGGSWDGYHPDNVPYDSSRSFIRVRKPSPETDIRENDMVFLLGFPGRTMRYAPTPRLRYADEVAVPGDVVDFTRKLKWIADFETDSSSAALKLGSTKKGLANELKRSRGKLVMMRKLRLLEERAAEETALGEATSGAATGVLSRLEEIYGSFRTTEPVSSALETLRGIYGGSSLLAAGHHIHEYLAEEKAKPDADRETTYRNRNLPFLSKRLTKRLRDVYLPHEAELVAHCAAILSELGETVGNDDGDDDELLKSCLEAVSSGTILKNGDTARGAVSGNGGNTSRLLEMSEDPSVDLLTGIFDENGDNDENNTAEAWLEDPFVKVAAALWKVYKRDKDTTKALASERDTLLAKLLEYQQEFGGGDEDTYPDCNGSLRISAGYVQRYQSADAVVHTPHTTLSGLLDKALEAKLGGSGGDEYGDSEFFCPDRLLHRLETDGSARDVPVCLLYSTDTVGGNSGSPVMNGKGELVAINFDRQRQGLMNEYKWSSRYSRSIGVDVRYILWLVGEHDGATHLVDELVASD